MTRQAYRQATDPDSQSPKGDSSPDADVLVLLTILSPVLLAPAAHALLRGESVGAGATVCGAIALFGWWGAVQAFRARRRVRADLPKQGT